MRFHRRRKTASRRSSRSRVRYLPGRAKTLEVLESREMLAADVVAPWHNAINPADVNFDHKVSPIDALLVVNDIMAHGSRALDPTAVQPFSSTSKGSAYYGDVSGDNRISPLDLVMVVNELLDSELMLVHSFATDLNDNPITTISVGQQFKLRVEVQDLRDPPAMFPGVYAAAGEVTFNSSLSFVDEGQTLETNDFFTYFDTEISQGRIISDAFSFEDPPGNAPQLFYTAVLTATAAGTQIFQPQFATPNHDYALLGDNGMVIELSESDIWFQESTLEIVDLPSLSISDVSQNEDAGNFNFTVTLSAAASQNVTVNYATANGTGANPATTADNDYQAKSGVLTFTPGQTMMVVPVTVNADSKVEANEEFTVTLSNVSANASINKAVGTGTILNDDVQATLNISNVTQNEDSGNFNFTVTLSQAASQNVTVNYATANGTGANPATTADNDYQAKSGVLTFTPGQTMMVIPVTVNADSKVEADEVFTVTLSGASANATIGNAVGTGTILNDDQPVTVSIAATSNGEEHPVPVNGVFTLTQSAITGSNTIVSYTVDGTATSGQDYSPLAGSVTITAGTTTATITVPVIDDDVVEGPETVIINLQTIASGAQNVQLHPTNKQATINIEDDEAALVSIAATTNGNEAGPINGVFTVTQAVTTLSNTVISYTVDGTATSGQDYSPLAGSVTITAGKTTATITVPVINDLLVEDSETVVVKLQSITSGDPDLVIDTNNDEATITIVSDDVATISIAATANGDETVPTNGMFTVTQSALTQSDTVISYSIDGTATPDADYTALAGSVTIAAGQTTATILVPVIDDDEIEVPETVIVTLESIAQGEAGVTINSGARSATVTIFDDDGAASLSVSDAMATPGTGAAQAVFTVTLSGDFTAPVTVGYATANDTALAGINYVAASGILTFTPGGPRTQEISVTVLGTAAPEPNKTFFINLSSQMPAGTVISDDLGIGTIVTQGLTISDATVVEGNSGTSANQAVFTVTLSLNTTETVTVAYATANDTAVAGSDYTSASGVLTFTSGPGTKLVTVPIFGDTVPEGNERFFLNLSNPSGAPVFNSRGVGTIINDDGDTVVLRLDVADLTGNPLPVGTTLDVDDEFLLQVFVTDVAAEPAGVFQTFLDVMYQSELVMPVGGLQFGDFYDVATFGTIGDGLIDDVGAFGEIEITENPGQEYLLFQLQFKAIANGLINFTGSVQNLDPNEDHATYRFFPAPEVAVPADEINIENRSINVGTNVVTVSSPEVTESSNLVFTFTRFLPDANPAIVVYQTADGTAQAGSDYVAKSGTLTFLPGGPNTQTVTVTVLNDTLDEPDETMSMVLTQVTGASGSLPGTGTILDDDPPVSVSANSPAAEEGFPLVFTVSLSKASGKTVTVNYATANPTSGIVATPGVDYTPTSGALTFAPGVTQRLVTVQLLGDIDFEPNETFRLNLSSPQNATIGTQGLGTIIDIPPAGISGFVFVDVNNNGIKDASETGIPGAIVTVTRQEDGTTTSGTTRADGSYVFDSLIPGTYTVKETQPGFYTDGRDVHMGVESATNDKYTNVALASGDRQSGYNFGERGVRTDFISAFLNRRALLASAAVGGFGPSVEMPGTTLDLRTGDLWVSFDGGWDGLRAIEAIFDSSRGTASMKLYNNSLQEIAVSIATGTGAILYHTGQLGQTYFLRISGTNPDVVVHFSETAPPVNLNQPTGGSGGGSQGGSSGQTTTSGSSSSSDPFTRVGSGQLMTAPKTEPLASADSSDASDEALAEDEDWLLEALLA